MFYCFAFLGKFPLFGFFLFRFLFNFHIFNGPVYIVHQYHWMSPEILNVDDDIVRRFFFLFMIIDCNNFFCFFGAPIWILKWFINNLNWNLTLYECDNDDIRSFENRFDNSDIISGKFESTRSKNSMITIY